MMPFPSDPGGNGPFRPAVALYIHLPFCRTRCTYCDFATYAGLESLMRPYVGAVCKEMEAEAIRWEPVTISSVYVGGGTPSLLPLDSLADLVRGVHSTFDLSRCREFTVEVNPGTVDQAYLLGLRSLGVDRLSVGIQSVHEDELHMLGRIHSWSEATTAVAAARRSGFDNLSLDLLFGLPGQTVETWAETLEEALALRPDHLSLYGLSLEEGTLLAQWVDGGQLPSPDEDRAATMYELAEDVLARDGFFHYEISNWARAEDEPEDGSRRWWPDGDHTDVIPSRSEEISPYVSRHNLTYWRNQPWLGVGAAAHSWMPGDLWRDDLDERLDHAEGRRWANPDHPEDYVVATACRSNPLSNCRDVQRINGKLEMGETMMLGLRLAEGVSSESFGTRFGVALKDVFGGELDDLRRLGLLTWDGRIARLTGRGRLLGNRVFERFL